MVERVIPKVMQEQKSAFALVAEANKQAVTARVENLDPNLCPICHSMLVQVKANGLDAKVCPDHNIVMPVKDV